MSVRAVFVVAAAAALAGTLSGCHDEAAAAGALTAADVRVASQQQVDDVRRRAADAYLRAAEAVAVARRRAHETALAGEREIARAQARADYDVSRKGCETLGHDARVACIAKAEKRYQQAMVVAERIEYAYLD